MGGIIEVESSNSAHLSFALYELHASLCHTFSLDVLFYFGCNIMQSGFQ